MEDETSCILILFLFLTFPSRMQSTLCSFLFLFIAFLCSFVSFLHQSYSLCSSLFSLSFLCSKKTEESSVGTSSSFTFLYPASHLISYVFDSLPSSLSPFSIFWVFFCSKESVPLKIQLAFCHKSCCFCISILLEEEFLSVSS